MRILDSAHARVHGRPQLLCHRPVRTASAMTLIELLVVVAIIGMLVALTLPAVQAARESARRCKCQNNLRQIGIALYNYHNAQRQLPIGCTEKRTASRPAARQLAWSAAILEHLDEKPLWQSINFSAAYDNSDNAAAAATILPVFLCPSTYRRAPGREGSLVIRPSESSGDSTEFIAAATDYGGIYGATPVSPSANGVFLYDRAIQLADITDGTSHTLAVAEDVGRGHLTDGQWINGENIFDVTIYNAINTRQDNEIWSDHFSGAMVLWCDGSVTLLAEGIDTETLRSICTRANDDLSGIAKQP